MLKLINMEMSTKDFLISQFFCMCIFCLFYGHESKSSVCKSWDPIKRTKIANRKASNEHYVYTTRIYFTFMRAIHKSEKL